MFKIHLESKLPKIGDKVIITKSNKNWVDDMDQYVGKIVKISQIYNQFKELNYAFETKNEFSNINRWD